MMIKTFLQNLNVHWGFPFMEVTSGSKYATKFSAGFDIETTEDVIIPPHSQVKVRTGLKVKNPDKPNYFSATFYGKGFSIVPELQIRPKSGLALKKQLTVTNSPGTVDADYPDEICVLLFNLSDTQIEFKAGNKVAQGVYAWAIRPCSEKSNETERTGGFGSTGS